MEKLSNVDGTYELSSEDINGKPSWTRGNIVAIWYHPTSKDWLIGRTSGIGGNVAWIQSIVDTDYGCPQQVPKDKWNFWDGNGWQQASSNDMNIKCAGKK